MMKLKCSYWVPWTFSLAVTATTLRAAGLPVELHVDLHRSQFDREDLTLLSGDSKLAKSTSAGFCVAIPAGGGNNAIRIGLPGIVGGDFEITTSYNVFDVGKPDKGPGAGICIWIGSNGKEGASIERLKCVGNVDVYCAHYSVPLEKGGREHHNQMFPTTARKGSLQLLRTDGKLHALVSDEQGSGFRELCELPFTAEPVTAIEFQLKRQGATTPLTIVLEDISLRAESYSLAPARRSQWPLRLMVTIGIISVVAACSVWYWWRRRSK